MNRLPTMMRFAKKVTLAKNSTIWTQTRHQGGAILGMRAMQQSSREVESLEISMQEGAVLTALLELPSGTFVLPLNHLSQQLRTGNPSSLHKVLGRMEKQGIIEMIQTPKDDTGVKLTLKGAVIALYGDWPYENPSNSHLELNSTLTTRLKPKTEY